ncbi:hypothetical protein N8T08_006104 [Aspergillus melleus]|uniref:Uncharacterized protein n=1 Tax=Aspergillus melleus TaxID=138277 RepID=A0ACC3B0W4_9EURO|nr:hypothetical protein N8T08_006104 [Aspergillus melleus]
MTPSITSDPELGPYYAGEDTKPTEQPSPDADPFGDEEIGEVKYRVLNWWQAGVLMIAENTSIGILSLPSAVSVLGIAPSIVLILGMAGISWYTGYTIGRFKLRYPHIHSMGDAGEVLFGPVGREIVGAGQLLFLVFLMGSHILTFSVLMNTLTNHGACTIVFSVIGLLVCFLGALPRTMANVYWMAIAFEFIGYCARASAHGKTGNMMPFCIQNVFILLGPALFAASVYMVLGRVVVAVKGEKYSIIPIRWLTKLFVLGDVLSFLIQGGAAGMMISTDLASLGNKLVIVGLVVQIIMFGLFIVTAVVFQVRMRMNPRPELYSANFRWKFHLVTLYIVSLLIMVRSLFRVAEFIMGDDGYLLQNEWPLYVFDATLMWLVVVIFAIRYPGDVLNGSHVHERVALNHLQGV